MKCCQFVLKFLFVLFIIAFSSVTVAGTSPIEANIFFNSNAAEPSANGTFTITISGQPVESFFVFYRVIGGSATEGSDFADFGSFGQFEDAGRIEFDGGPLSIQVPLVVIDDPTPEGDETVLIEISQVSSTGSDSITIGPNVRITVTIEDDDEAATFTVSKFFSDDNPMAVDVSLVCSDASIDQTPKSASQSSPAVFNLTNVGSNQRLFGDRDCAGGLQSEFLQLFVEDGRSRQFSLVWYR